MLIFYQMDWSNELVLSFLEHYKCYDVIWDPNHPEHKNKSSVIDAWELLRKEMGTDMTVADLKRKKDALMATYRTLIKKIQIAKDNGDGQYKPSWFCYSTMNTFLHNIYKPKFATDYNGEEPKDIFENSNFEYEDFDLPEQDIFTEEKPVINTKKRKIEYDDVQQEMSNISEVHQINQLTQTNSNQSVSVRRTDADEISLYGELLVTKLRKFDRTTRLIICNKIDNLFFETELKLMTDGKNSYQDPLSHDVPTTSRSGKRSLKRSSSHSSFSQSEMSENPQFE